MHSMYNGYADKEKRRIYMKEWRFSNRKKIRKYFRKYLLERNKDTSTHILRGKSGMGRRWELFALSILKDSKDCNKKSFKGKWDIEWMGKRIDVKSSHEGRKGYTFHRGFNNDPDYFMCFCIKNSKVISTLFVPGIYFPKINLVFNPSGYKSKWWKYSIDIKQFIEQ